MQLNEKHLRYMGATPQIIDAWKRSGLLITWDRSGYSVSGIITARKLSAAQVLRCIVAAAQR